MISQYWDNIKVCCYFFIINFYLTAFSINLSPKQMMVYKQAFMEHLIDVCSFFYGIVICRLMQHCCQQLELLLQKTVIIQDSGSLVFQSSQNHQNFLILFLSNRSSTQTREMCWSPWIISSLSLIMIAQKDKLSLYKNFYLLHEKKIIRK